MDHNKQSLGGARASERSGGGVTHTVTEIMRCDVAMQAAGCARARARTDNTRAHAPVGDAGTVERLEERAAGAGLGGRKAGVDARGRHQDDGGQDGEARHGWAGVAAKSR